MNHFLRHLYIILILLGGHSHFFSQSSYLKKDHRAYHFLDRLNVLHDYSSNIHSSIKYITRDDVNHLIQYSDTISLSEGDLRTVQYLNKELHFSHDLPAGSQKGWFGHFYKNPAHFYELQTKDFELRINPFLDFNVGRDQEEGKTVFLNKRGLEIFGNLDQRFYFYTSIHENQSNFLNYIEPFIANYKTLPGQGNYKDYQSGIINAFIGFDYSNAQAYLGYKISKHVDFELGHGKHFLGNGMRSLLLSDYAHNYFYFKMNTRVWKIHYQSIFAELSSSSPRQTLNNELLPKKYMAAHMLNFKISNNFELGLFESIIFSREDHFEFQYLNPIILYRTAEHFLDSPDNVLIGLSGKLNVLNRLSIYGQFLLDELLLKEFFSSSGWWGNKYGIQLGIKYFDILGIDQLDGQFEINRVRPYTYSHFQESNVIPTQSVSSYSHFNQALAHPLGANFTELIIKLRHRPTAKLLIESRYIYTIVGRDDSGNYGSDILQLNTTRIADFNIDQHQGAKSTIKLLNLDLSYEIFHDYYLDLHVLFRKDNNVKLSDLSTKYWSIGMRYNISNTKIDY